MLLYLFVYSICIGAYGNNTPSGSMYSPAHPTSPGGVSVAESHFSTTSHNYGGSSNNQSQQQQQQLQPRAGSTVSACTYLLSLLLLAVISDCDLTLAAQTQCV
jgi:hypothetical protein